MLFLHWTHLPKSVARKGGKGEGSLKIIGRRAERLVKIFDSKKSIFQKKPVRGHVKVTTDSVRSPVYSV